MNVIRVFTESEASNRWCPFTRERPHSMSPSANCIGSQCMVWRLHIPDDWRQSGEDRGYCGLTSAPDTIVDRTKEKP